MDDLATRLEELDRKATRHGWTLDRFGNICIGMKPLWKRTGASHEDAALTVELKNNLPEIIAALRGRLVVKEPNNGPA